MNKDEMIKNDRRKIMDLLYKLKKGELCTPNCYGCCGDNELDFAYCPDVADNFEKELANLGYRKVADDEIVIKKSEQKQWLKYCIDSNKKTAEIARKETAREILALIGKPNYRGDDWYEGAYDKQEQIREQIANEYGIELE